MTLFTADRRLYLTADRKHVVEDGDPKAAFLLLPKGGEMSDGEAKKFGLEKAIAKPQDKAIAQPQDKAIAKVAKK